jgi:hypothetical protein
MHRTAHGWGTERRLRALRHNKSFLAGSATGSKQKTSPLFEIARLLVRFDYVARLIVNADHSMMYAAVKRPAVLSEVTPEISQPERDCHLKSGLIRRSHYHYLLDPFLRARQNRG